MIKSQSRFVSQLTKDSVAIILAGGQGKRLQDLTQYRAKPALHFGGKFRIIDFPLSNCINSGIRRVGVITQYKAHSLIRHLIMGWGNFNRDLGEFVELLPASQQYSDNWYLGTADALYQNLQFLRTTRSKYVLVLAGDQVYQMDYGLILAEHAESGADLTVSCLEMPCAEAAERFGVMAVDPQHKIRHFEEKPKRPTPLPDKHEHCFASTGIYVFNTDFLIDVLHQDAHNVSSSHDFGHDIIPACVRQAEVHAHKFCSSNSEAAGYWKDVGTLDTYWMANMELIAPLPSLNLYDEDWPIWTYQKQAPPAKFVFNDDFRRGCAVDSLVSGGCIVSGSQIEESLLFTDVHVQSYSHVKESVVLPKVNLGKGTQISRAIIDSHCVIPDGMRIGLDKQEDEAQGFRVTDNGVTVVTQDMLDNRARNTTPISTNGVACPVVEPSVKQADLVVSLHNAEDWDKPIHPVE